MPTQPISNPTTKAATSIEASVRVTRLPLPSSSVFHTLSLGNFREAHMPEAQFPRRPLLGSSVNKGKKGGSVARASALVHLHRPELLHQAQMVLLSPVLGDLAVLDTGYKDARKTDPLARRLDTHQFTGMVRLVDVAHRHLVVPCQEVLDAHVRLREGRIHHGD